MVRHIYPHPRCLLDRSQTNLTWTFCDNSQGSQRFVGFFLNCTFRMLIDWADKLRSRG